MNNLPEVIFNLIYLLLSVGISLAFWINIKGDVKTKLLASMHSAFLLFILIFALFLGLNGHANETYQVPFTVILLIPLASIAYSFKIYEGSKRIHILHLWNFVALIWTWFIGSMAITGDWL